MQLAMMKAIVYILKFK